MPEALRFAPIVVQLVIDFHRPSLPVGDTYLLGCHLVEVGLFRRRAPVYVECCVVALGQQFEEAVHIVATNLVAIA